MLTCKEVAKLISDGLDHRLTWRQRLGLRLHVMMCKACATYKKQLEAIERAIEYLLHAGDPGREKAGHGSALNLSRQKREEIRQLVRSTQQ